MAASICTPSSSVLPCTYDVTSILDTTPEVTEMVSPPIGYPTTATASCQHSKHLLLQYNVNVGKLHHVPEQDAAKSAAQIGPMHCCMCMYKQAYMYMYKYMHVGFSMARLQLLQAQECLAFLT